MNSDAILAAVHPILAAFEQLGVAYYLGGSVVSSAYGLPNKLEWYRIGGEISDRQWKDILGVLKTRCTTLDLAYMREWAAQLKVLDLLERALIESGLTKP